MTLHKRPPYVQPLTTSHSPLSCEMNSTPSDLTRRALHTQRSVVVEACAGSGKTWLLASRIVRLLLEGVAPGEILAITFTRKAAREIEERVVGWLRELATGSDAQLDTFLRERGLGTDDRLRRSARALYEQVLTAQPPLTVNTFHGWFLQLIEAAPLTANLAGATLVETDARQFDEHWQRFADSLQKAPDSPVAQAFVRLLALAGQDSAQKLIRRAFDRRSEWLALGGDVDQALALLRDGTGAEGEALATFFTARRMDEIQAYLGFLESNTPSDQQRAQSLREALTSLLPASGRGESVSFEALRGTLLTNENTLRKRELNKTLEKRFGEGAARFVELHARLGEAVLRCLEQQVAERALAFNEDACTVFADFLAQVEAYKQARRQIDFADAEWTVLRLLRDEATAAFVQARLDARYRHVLLDEFQDTNPLQWQVLRAWLDAYSDDERPTLFLVGDPKQSIYRFRRAEPRLFAVAADFLKHHFAAEFLEQDATRRNALPIVDVVNALFLDEARFTPFREQTSQAGNLPGRVELLPLFGRDIAEETPPRSALRDPLREAETEPEDQRLHREADALAAKILEITGSDDGQAWQITEKDQTRPARYGDFMLLLRSRTHMATYEHALAAVGIPFDAGSCGGLLTALEVRDLLALLEFLTLPSDNLKLAQTLRSPLFACTDEELLCLAGTRECSWWQRLQALGSTAVFSLSPDAETFSLSPRERAGVREKGKADNPTSAHSSAAFPHPQPPSRGERGEAISPRLVRAARLLDAWQHDADRLPAHDLLDRIYHQGEVLARYRLAVPPALADRVEANLNALLLLALDLDGGRYPSLPRFIDELRQLSRTDARDAPDEGEIAAPTLGTGRVRLLTIHGAKGLEAPIVWLLGANDPPRGSEAWDIITDWPPADAVPNHFSFYGRREDCGLARASLFEAEATAAAREELNLLYVAITRARQVFIASGIEKKRPTETAYDLLSKALEKLGDPLSHGPRLPVGPSLPSPASGRGEKKLPPVGERRSPPGEAERYGILLHTLLERYSEGRDGDASLHPGFSAETCRQAAAQARRLLATPELRRFFDPAQSRRAWNEVDIRDGDGRLRRIDRLVEQDDAFWVLDYKSGGSDSERLDEYRQQVGDYCRAIASIHPDRPVHGALLFADGSLLTVY